MSSSTIRLNSFVFDARRQLADGRDKLKSQHDAGSPGIQLCAYLADLRDSIVLQVYETAMRAPEIQGQLAAQVAIVAHGGYGRRDVAPFSDVDLMLLHQPSATSQITKLARRLIQDLCDVGLDLGFSVRTPWQACQLGARDPVVFTSLVESRYLAGNHHLYSRFVARFRRMARRRSRVLIKLIERARIEERVKYGETVYLLEPNIKRSRGALRDIHLLRWVGFARYGKADPDHLRRMGLLSLDEQRKLRSALEFLLKIRNDLHFNAVSPQDVLSRSEQVRLARLGSYPGDAAVLPVERFMQEYFGHTSEVRNIVEHFLATAKSRSMSSVAVHNLLGHQVERDFVVGPRYIGATRRGRLKVRGNLVQVLRMMDLANRYNKHIDHATWQVIRESMSTGEVAMRPEAAERFMSLLSQPGRLGKLLRRLHELRVLEKLVPGFDHARCLLQFNEYHKYTVDEHSIRAVEQATGFASHHGLLGHVYRQINPKSTLHLALLIHDIGKGYPEDHSEVGRRIAERVAQYLRLADRESERLAFLVHRHLILNHLAFRRDNSDPSLILEAAAEIGSPANLRMLFVLTCADLAAVGPGVLNQWKLEVLSDLYRRIMDHLSGGTPVSDFEQLVVPERGQLLLASQGREQADWFASQINALPPAYLNGPSVEFILEDLDRLRGLGKSDAVAWGRYLPNRDIIEYSVGAHENIAEGIFHRLTGALTSQGLQILSAEIHSLADSLILDRFYVHDPDYRGQPPVDRFQHVSGVLTNSLENNSADLPVFRRIWRKQPESATLALTNLPTQVRVDNSTSDRYTIVDVFTHDRTGLLYAIARTLFELRLSVRIAKIGTYLDQVVDVFYVTDVEGAKVQEERRLAEIRSRLFQAIESWKGPT